MSCDAIRYHIIGIALSLSAPHVFNRRRAPLCVQVLHIFVGVFAVRVENDLPDALPGLVAAPVAQFKNRLQNDFRRVRFAAARHAEKRGFLTQQIGGKQFNRNIVHALKGAIGGRIAHPPQRHPARRLPISHTLRLQIVDDAPQSRSIRLINLQAAIGIIVRQVAAEAQHKVIASRTAGPLVEIKSADDAAAHTRKRKQLMRVGIHDGGAIPMRVRLA